MRGVRAHQAHGTTKGWNVKTCEVCGHKLRRQNAEEQSLSGNEKVWFCTVCGQERGEAV
jgi:hypothetical protein